MQNCYWAHVSRWCSPKRCSIMLATCKQETMHVCLCFCQQDVVTVCRTAVATFPLLASPTGTPLTCTASGEYLSHQAKRWERVSEEWLLSSHFLCLSHMGKFTAQQQLKYAHNIWDNGKYTKKKGCIHAIIQDEWITSPGIPVCVYGCVCLCACVRVLALCEPYLSVIFPSFCL